MQQKTLALEEVLAAAQRHLAARRVCTFATSHRDVPWAATAFYVAREFDIFTCQRKGARTLTQMLANPRTAVAVDDQEVGAWFQALGTARMVGRPDDEWARAALGRTAPEFARHFTNPDYPVLAVSFDEFTFVDRGAGITPRQHLLLEDGAWRFA